MVEADPPPASRHAVPSDGGVRAALGPGLAALVARVQAQFLRGTASQPLFDNLLPTLLTCTGSTIGVIGEVLHDRQAAASGSKTSAAEPAWAAVASTPLNSAFDRLLGTVLSSAQPLLFHDASDDVRGDQSVVHSFAGIPLLHGGELVGAIGLANRPGGYDAALLAELAPLTTVIAAISGSLQFDRQRLAAEQALRDSELRWYRSLELAGAGVLTLDGAGRVTEANARAQELFGQQTAGLRGQPLSHLLLPAPALDVDAVCRRLGSGSSLNAQFDARFHHATGDERWGQFTATPSFDGAGRLQQLVVVMLDIDQQKRAELALREREAMFTALARNVPGVLLQAHLTTDGTLSVPYASERLQDVFELDPHTVRHDGRPLIQRVVDGQRHAVWLSIDRSARDGQPWTAEFEVDLPGRGRCWVAGRAGSERNADGSTTWHGFMCDITERKAIDASLLAARAAEQANEAKTEFLSRMSHELRTPLNAVLGFAQLLMADPSEPLRDGQRNRVAHIERAGQHLLAMIGDVLDLSRIEAGSLPLALQPLALRTALQEATALVATTAHASGVVVDSDLPDQTTSAAELHVQADPTRLRQVLVNLLSNAIKYNRSGGHVRIGAEADGADTVRIAVSDTGIGLTPAQQLHLFEPFNRLGAERSNIDGTGLGLTITRRLVELMGGTLTVHSTAGHGSTFSIDLPRALPRGANGVAGARIAAARAPHTVLYAEDNRLNIELVRQVLLLRDDCVLQIARSGREAIDCARSSPPDLLLIDMHLGDMTGLDVLDALRHEATLQQVPRVVLSADALPDHVQTALDHGFDDYLTKPVDVAELLRCIDRHLAARQAAQTVGH